MYVVLHVYLSGCLTKCKYTYVMYRLQMHVMVMVINADIFNEWSGQGNLLAL